MEYSEHNGGEDRGLSREDYARALFRIKAVTICKEAPLTWGNGFKVPVYFDNRLTNSHPSLRRRITDSFVERLGTCGLVPAGIVGTATAAVPQAALLAERLNIPMAYVRPKAKGYGHGRQIEGHVAQGQRVVIVEDLLATGMSAINVIDAVRACAQAHVLAVVANFTFGFPEVADLLSERGVPLYTLCDFNTLIGVGASDGALSPEDVAAVRASHKDPAAWSEAYAA